MKRVGIYAVALLIAVTLLAVWAAPAPAQDKQGIGIYKGALLPGPLTAETCSNPQATGGSFPWTYSWDTSGARDDYNLSAAGSCAGGGVQYDGTGLGEDQAYLVVTDQDCPIAVSMDPVDGVDLALYVLSPSCEDAAGGCIFVDDGGGAGAEENVEFMATSGQRFFVIVDGFNGASGSYDLTLESSGSCHLVSPVTADVGELVWEDTDADGIQDVDELPLRDVEVNLYTCTGTLVDKTYTTVSFWTGYHFVSLLPGEYFVEFVLPPGYEFSPRDQGGNDDADSDADPDTGRTACFELQSGAFDMRWDAGVHPETFDLGDRVWYDTDRDGIQDASEPGVQGITVDLYESADCGGNLLDSEVTDGSGFYSFTSLSPGNYCLDVWDGIPSNWNSMLSPQDQGSDDTLDSDANEFHQIENISLSADDPTQDVGVYARGKIGSHVWCDQDGDNSYDADEGVTGVVVNLYADANCDGVAEGLVNFRDTDGSGDYLFQEVPAGPPGGPSLCYVVAVDASGMGACNEPITPLEYDVALEANNLDDLDNNFGFRAPAVLSLGDRVWYDTDQDGIQDAGEPGVQGIAVELYGSAVCGGNLVASDVTDGSGFYGFSSLPAGAYCLSLWDGIPTSWYFSPQDQGGDDTVDSDAAANGTIQNINLSADDPTRDVGAYALGSIGEWVWCDADGDSAYDASEGVAGVSVSLLTDTNCDGVGDGLHGILDTSAGGHYQFANMRVGPPGGPPVCYVAAVYAGDMGACSESITPAEYAVALEANNPDDLDNNFGFRVPSGMSLGDRVWYDTDQDGIQDAGEPGVQSIPVVLYDDFYCAGNVLATDTTDASGHYSFDGLSPSLYCLDFSQDIPSAWDISSQNQGGDDTRDSDVDGSTGLIENINLSANDPTQDLGLFAPGAIGDRVFCDYDGSKQADPGEFVQGVTVHLFDDANCDTLEDSIWDSQDTDDDGVYYFHPLVAGPPGGPPVCYMVTVDVNDMGTCKYPILPVKYAIALEANDPEHWGARFGFSEQPPATHLVYLPLIIRGARAP